MYNFTALKCEQPETINNPTTSEIDALLNHVTANISENFSDNQKQLFLLKLLEFSGTEMNVCTETLIARNADKSTDGNCLTKAEEKFKRENSQISDYKKSLKSLHSLIANYFTQKYSSGTALLNPSEWNTFRHHYISINSFRSMYDCNIQTDDDKTEQVQTLKRDQYVSYADRSNTQKKLFTALRGFKSKKPKKNEI